MIVPARRLHRYVYADYVAVERDSTIKHEFLDGEIYAMAGGSEEHSALAAKVVSALEQATGDGPSPTLRDYVVVSHRERRITVHSRRDSSEWMTRVAITGGRVGVTALSAQLVVDDIYRKSSVR